MHLLHGCNGMCRTNIRIVSNVMILFRCNKCTRGAVQIPTLYTSGASSGIHTYLRKRGRHMQLAEEVCDLCFVTDILQSEIYLSETVLLFFSILSSLA